MALSPLRSKFLHHNRSLSFPSKLNPSSTHLHDVKALETSCSSLSSMTNSLAGLKNLYIAIDDLLLLPHIQQIISRDSKWVDQVLDGHISLLDACSSAKDLVSDTKANTQSLLSSLRRRDLNGIPSYLNCRRKSKKNIQKSLKELRSSRSQPILATLERDSETSDLVCKLNEAESITIAKIELLLSYLVGNKQSGWSLVAKLINSKSYQGEGNEFEKMDAFLQMSVEGAKVEEHMSLLKEIDLNIQTLEEELECLFRQLIRTRVFLLNILNH